MQSNGVIIQAEIEAWTIRGQRDFLPVAYHGCPCMCHRMKGMKHVVACCSPTKGPLVRPIRKGLGDLDDSGS